MHHPTPRLLAWLVAVWLACSAGVEAQSGPPAAGKPAASKPAEGKPAEEKPADAEPAEASPAESKLTDVKSAEAPPGSPTPLSATVVALDGDDLVIDAGRDRAKEGAMLTLYRTLEVKHPVTGAVLRDRFPNGSARVVQAGEALSIAKLVSPPPRAPLVGDQAEAPSASAEPEISVDCAACAPIAEAQAAILEVFYHTLGKTPAERVKVFQAHLEAQPATPYKSWLEYEINYFRSQQFGDSAVRTARASYDSTVQALVKLSPLEHVRAGLPVELGVYVPPETRVRSVSVLLTRNKRGAYTRRKIVLDQRGQGRVRIPDELVKTPGFFYFVESASPDNRVLSVLGSEALPKYCAVEPAPKAASRSDMSRVRAVGEYVSFDGLSGRDYYYLAEADFLLRVHRRFLEGVRVGYGHYRGKGGSLEDLDEKNLAPQPAAFTYGYLETVIALHEMFAVMPRIEVGLGRPADENSPRARVRSGGQLRLRIGRARGTHLILAGESTPEIGQRAFVGLTLGLLEKWPLAFEVHVTDQPVNTDELGVRAVFELGYRPSDVFSLSARGSYQGRTIDHAGPGFGLAATFDW